MQAPKDDGFTLIELLVVTIVIAALAAIAIPTYMGQTQRAFDSQMKTSLRSLATNEETFLATNNRYGTISELVSGGAVIARSPGVTIHLIRYGASTGYCLKATHTSTTDTWYWDSVSGGLQATGATDCPLMTSGVVGDSLP